MKTKLIFILACMVMFPIHAQWNQVVSGTSTYLHSVVFPTAQVGYAVGGHPNGNANGIILKTIDGGSNWNIIYSDGNLSFREVIFLNANTGIVVSFSNILRTTDGGQNWQTISIQPPIKILDISFIDGTFHLLGAPNNSTIGTVVYKSSDTGVSWNQIYQSDSVYLGSISFIDPMHGYAAEGDGSGNAFDKIYKTIDGGLTWQNMSFQIYNYTTSEILAFSDSLTGFSGGWYADHFMKTTDGGYTWQEMNIEDDGTMPSTYFISIQDNIVYAGGPKIFRSDDLGLTWTEQPVPIPLSNTNGINDIFIINQDTAIAVGYDGIILRTTNGGGTMGTTDNGNFKKKIKIYPNPSNGTLILEIPDYINIKNVKIMDIQGKIVQIFNSAKRKLNISGLETGTYLLLISTELRTITKKIVVE